MRVVIPSGYTPDLVLCLEALYKFHPDAEVFILADKNFEEVMALSDSRFYFAQGPTPFSWPASVNKGLEHFKNQDVLVLDDNAFIQTSMDPLFETAGREDVAIVGPCVQGTAPEYQQEDQKRPEVPWVIGCAMLVSGKFDGRLDESFTGYGFWESDLSRTAKKQKFKTVVDHRAKVIHKDSTLYAPRKQNDPPSLLNRKRYLSKWGDTEIWRV